MTRENMTLKKMGSIVFLFLVCAAFLSAQKSDEAVFITEEGWLFHKQGCGFLIGEPKMISEKEAKKLGRSPCRACLWDRFPSKDAVADPQAEAESVEENVRASDSFDKAKPPYQTVAEVPKAKTKTPSASGKKAAKGKKKAPNQSVLLTKKDKKFHRKGCKLLKKEKNVLELPVADAISEGFSPCPSCKPR